MKTSVLIAIVLLLQVGGWAEENETEPYRIVDTGQVRSYDDRKETSYPKSGASFFGQDAHYQGHQPSYRDNGDGTVSDLNTGLMWQADPGEKRSFKEALAGAAKCRTGGHTDWRLPTIKELYSLILFSGTDPDPRSQGSEDQSPFIDTKHFKFEYGKASDGERVIDAQYASSTKYVGTTMGGQATVFGVNFADGRIKGYGLRSPRGRGQKTFCVLYVRGNPKYGRNDFLDNRDGTVTDRATGLMWMKVDSGALKAGSAKDGKMNWSEALLWAEGLKRAGHTDWRLPNAKELQSIVDYTRSPDTTKSPAIDPVFECTPITNEGGKTDYAHYWTGTTHAGTRRAAAAVYIAFGRALGFMSPPGRGGGGSRLMDVHGAGAQRSDDKSGDPSSFPQGRGPQGDVVRIENLVRCVRGGAVTVRESGPDLKRISQPDRPGDEGAPTGNRFVRRLDKDGDNRVSREEFDGPPRAFDRHDENGDGYIDADEAPSGPPGGGQRPGEGGRQRPGRGPRKQQEDQENRHAKTLEVLTVGTGSPSYNPERSRPSMLVSHGNTSVLVDMGEGTDARLQQAGIGAGTIDAYFFTHHHRDHNADAMTILPTAWQRGFSGPIVGPKGTSSLVTFLWEFYAEDLEYRMGNRQRLAEPVVHELPRASALTVGSMKITTTEVPHSITTFAYRFDAGGRSIVISGDLSFSEALIQLAKDVDILVIDSGGVSYEGDRPRSGGNGRRTGGEENRNSGRGRNRAMKRPPHATCEEVARMATGANAKKLVLVHFREGTVDEAATRKRMSPIYSGEIVFASDLATYR